MPVFGVNMAVPVKENLRESQIYFLSSAENVPTENHTIDKKYLIFKTFELIISLCSLMLFAYGMRATENEIEEMLKYITLGGLTIYPLLFILLSINIKRRPILSIIFNTSAVIILFAIAAFTMSSSWTKVRYFSRVTDKEKYSETLMQLRSAFLISINGILYLIESLIMCIEIRRHYCDSN